ncbi:MAG: FAD-dependent oxidoreductase [Thaumarchaeota archaeon]|nr:FAD-dependent oxidoreductase [Nitrososphaerota archaeon]
MVTTINVPIVQRCQLQEGILEVTCKLHGNEFPYKAGQNIQVTLPSLLFNDPKGKTRTFNILSSPNNSEYISFAFFMSDSGFKKSISQIPENSKIQIKGPFGLFTLPNDNKNLVFITEGVGVIPIIGIILFATEEKLRNNMILLLSGKKDIPYGDDLASIEKINSNLSVKTKIGSITSSFIKNNIKDFKNTLFYLSGTSETISKIKLILLQNGVSIRDLMIEEFIGY